MDKLITMAELKQEFKRDRFPFTKSSPQKTWELVGAFFEEVERVEHSHDAFFELGLFSCTRCNNGSLNNGRGRRLSNGRGRRLSNGRGRRLSNRSSNNRRDRSLNNGRDRRLSNGSLNNGRGRRLCNRRGRRLSNGRCLRLSNRSSNNGRGRRLCNRRGRRLSNGSSNNGRCLRLSNRSSNNGCWINGRGRRLNNGSLSNGRRTFGRIVGRRTCRRRTRRRNGRFEASWKERRGRENVQHGSADRRVDASSFDAHALQTKEVAFIRNVRGARPALDRETQVFAAHRQLYGRVRQERKRGLAILGLVDHAELAVEVLPIHQPLDANHDAGCKHDVF